MAPRRDQLTLEARLTVCPGAEIHLGCIRRTGVIWSYELRLSSMTCQNDRNKKSYTQWHTLSASAMFWRPKTACKIEFLMI